MTFFLVVKLLHRNNRFKNNLPFVVVDCSGFDVVVVIIVVVIVVVTAVAVAAVVILAVVVVRSWPLTVKIEKVKCELFTEITLF
jgi:hypothetical protein